jgi:hypothetical protein
MFLNAPRGFRDASILASRYDLLGTAEKTVPLETWARGVEKRRQAKQPDIVVPHFDPAEAGIAARALLLLEAPGPKAITEFGGSGFISSDNNDVTAENTWRARDAAGLRDHFLAWNTIPWVLGRASVKPTATELAQGAIELRGLLDLLPDLRVIVLAGDKAKAAWDSHLDNALGDQYRVFRTVHPAGMSFARAGNREKFTETLTRTAELVM